MIELFVEQPLAVPGPANYVHAAALKEFTLLQFQDSKVRNVPFKDLALQKYLKCPDFTRENCKILTALLPHSVQGIKANFSSVHTN